MFNYFLFEEIYIMLNCLELYEFERERGVFDIIVMYIFLYYCILKII